MKILLSLIAIVLFASCNDYPNSIHGDEMDLIWIPLILLGVSLYFIPGMIKINNSGSKEKVNDEWVYSKEKLGYFHKQNSSGIAFLLVFIAAVVTFAAMYLLGE